VKETKYFDFLQVAPSVEQSIAQVKYTLDQYDVYYGITEGNLIPDQVTRRQGEYTNIKLLQVL
jgi:hypothetical protein